MTRFVSIALVAFASFAASPRMIDESAVGIALAADAPTPEPTATDPTPSATSTETPLPTEQPTLAPTEQPSPTSSPTPEPTLTGAATAGPSATVTPTPTSIPATASSATATARATSTPRGKTATLNAATVSQTAPTCSLAPSAGVVGQRVVVRCGDFAAGDVLGAKWRSLAGNVAVIATDGTGQGSAAFAVPDVGYGSRSVRITGSDGAGVRLTFSVRRPSITLSPATGTNRSTTTVQLRGFAASEQVEIRWYSLAGSTVSTIGTATLSNLGSADVALTIPRRSGSGGHRIDAVAVPGGRTASTVFSVIPAGGSRYLDQGSAGCGRIAILFNIGIGYPLDTGVLATLKARGVPATMFAMGWWADANPRILTRLANDGYLIGSHGYARQELTSESDDVVRADIRAASAAIDGRVRNLIAAEGYTPVGWRISAADYDTTATEESVYSRVVGNTYDGAIVEFHIDGPATAASTGRALPRIIDTLRARGFTFVSVPQMAVGCSVPSPFRRPATFQGEMIGDVRRVEGRRTGA